MNATLRGLMFKVCARKVAVHMCICRCKLASYQCMSN